MTPGDALRSLVTDRTLEMVAEGADRAAGIVVVDGTRYVLGLMVEAPRRAY